MKSEKEIREEINQLLLLEKEAEKDIEEIIINNELDYLSIYIERANVYQRQRIVLEWVLEENSST